MASIQVKYKVIMVPLVSFFVLLGLIVFLVSFLISRIEPLRNKISADQKQNIHLSSRFNTLSEIKPEILNMSDNIYLALPDRNPASYVLSHLRRLAATNNINITDLSITKADIEGEELARSMMDIEADGSYEDALLLVKSLEKLAPVVNIDHIKITKSSQDSVNITAALLSYWAELPENLPTYDESFSALTEEELSVLNIVSGLEQPTFSKLDVTEEQLRNNPFSIED